MDETEPDSTLKTSFPFTVPCYDRLQDLAAFSLGLEPRAIAL
jgi:hypothetical protein